MSAFLKVIRFLLSLVIIPVCVITTINFYDWVSRIKGVRDTGFIFILGAFCYCAVHLILFKLDFLYILGHESMHAIATLFSGGKVLGMKVSSKEGSVKTTTPNTIVTLAPYILPGYTILIGVIYFILSFFMDTSNYINIFIFLIGFTLMFHLAYTAQSIREKQSDLLKTGYLFSISFIYLVNIISVFFIISLFFNELIFSDFIRASYEGSRDFYYGLFEQVF
ncbi:MAG: hypothetical protein ABH848_00555 [Candidatus Omnitrophota bacterium]